MKRNNVQPFYKEDPLLSWWRRYRPYWHIGMGLLGVVFFTGIAWAQYITINPRLTDLEKFRERTEPVLSQMQQNLQDLHEWYAADHGKATR